MATLEDLMASARETNQTFLNVDAELDAAEAVVKKLREKWGEANSAREKAEGAVLAYIRGAVNG